jgi:hypothetical protein
MMADQTGAIADQTKTAKYQHEFFSSPIRREIENLSPFLVEAQSEPVNLPHFHLDESTLRKNERCMAIY